MQNIVIQSVTTFWRQQTFALLTIRDYESLKKDDIELCYVHLPNTKLIFFWPKKCSEMVQPVFLLLPLYQPLLNAIGAKGTGKLKEKFV